MRIFIAGATGLIGRRLVRHLLARADAARGDALVVLSRSASKARQTFGTAVEIVEGDPQVTGAWMKAVDGCDAVINLVGEPIADRAWTDTQKARIRDSRIETSRRLQEAIAQATVKPRTWVQGTAVGIYGERGDEPLTEDSPPSSTRDFITELCIEWEAEALRAEALGVRVVLIRTGIVLDKSGGALEKMLLPFKLFVGGPLGNGEQWFPWIHADDLVGLILFALDTPSVRGPLNGAAPSPTTMKAFSSTLGDVMRRPSWMPVPRFALSILMGDRAPLILASQKVLPTKALQSGYQFHYTSLRDALSAVLEGG